jgi:hypothetical protein
LVGAFRLEAIDKAVGYEITHLEVISNTKTYVLEQVSYFNYPGRSVAYKYDMCYNNKCHIFKRPSVYETIQRTLKRGMGKNTFKNLNVFGSSVFVYGSATATVDTKGFV